MKVKGKGPINELVAKPWCDRFQGPMLRAIIMYRETMNRRLIVNTIDTAKIARAYGEKYKSGNKMSAVQACSNFIKMFGDYYELTKAQKSIIMHIVRRKYDEVMAECQFILQEDFSDKKAKG